MSAFFLYAAIFVAALLLADILIRNLFGARRKQSEVNYRLELLERNKDQLKTYDELLRQRRLGKDTPVNFSSTWLSIIYTQSGIKFNGTRIAMYLALIFVVSAIFIGQFLDNFVFRLAGGALLAALLSFLLLLYVRSKRIAKFVGQLAETIDVIVRSVGAGHPVPAAISLVAKEMPDPVGTEFGLLTDEMTYGIELDDAMINMVHRVGADELKLLAVSMSVQRSTGGNLTEILENLSNVIRDRALIKAKIKAISAEGRITALIMAAFPFALFSMIRAMVPDYFDPLWNSGYGTTVVTTCGVFMIFGIIILYRLVKFDF